MIKEPVSRRLTPFIVNDLSALDVVKEIDPSVLELKSE